MEMYGVIIVVVIIIVVIIVTVIIDVIIDVVSQRFNPNQRVNVSILLKIRSKLVKY